MKNVIKYNCPICNIEHDVEIRREKTNAIIKNKEVEYFETIYLCKNSTNENKFVPVKIMDENLLKARDAYRKDIGLLTSNEIKDIRKKYSLTQSEFSKMLGFGEITITRYESKKIQDETYDYLIRMAGENPLYAYESLKRNKSRFSIIKYEEIKKRIKNNINNEDISFLKKQEIYYRYMKYDEKSLLNGNKIIDIDKIENTISYIALNTKNLFKVKLMKLLWYSDFIYFKKYNISLTGLVYKHMLFGALPIAYNEIVYLKNIEIKEIMLGTDIGYLIGTKKNKSNIALSKNEKEIINMVIEYFKYMNSSEIIERMHSEKAYTKTVSNEIISYKYSKYIDISIK